MATALLRVLVSQGLVSGYLSGTPRNIVRYPPAKTAETWISVNRKSIIFASNHPGVQDPRVALSIAQSSKPGP